MEARISPNGGGDEQSFLVGTKSNARRFTGGRLKFGDGKRGLSATHLSARGCKSLHLHLFLTQCRHARMRKEVILITIANLPVGYMQPILLLM